MRKLIAADGGGGEFGGECSLIVKTEIVGTPHVVEVHVHVYTLYIVQCVLHCMMYVHVHVHWHICSVYQPAHGNHVIIM